jgi:hypothetical protein
MQKYMEVVVLRIGKLVIDAAHDGRDYSIELQLLH